MDYEKAYKEALERARKVKHDVQLIGCAMNADMLEVVFPELEESEDERIRKALIDLVYSDVKELIFGVEKRLCISWLEKQKENPKTDHSMPSNCVSDVKWADKILTNAIVALANDVDYTRDETLRYKQEINDLRQLREDIKKLKEQKPLSTEETELNSIAFLGQLGYTCIPPGKEQQPAELPKSEDYGIDGLYAAIDILQRTLGEVDGYQTDDGILEHKCAISAVKELYEQKPAEWSEEDENKIESIKGLITTGKFVDTNTIRTIWKLLDSIRLRPHWKPSEEQMQGLRRGIVKADEGSDAKNSMVSLYSDLQKLL